MLDTNVIVSGILNPYGAPGRVVDLLISGDLQPLFDDRIIAEYQAVLSRPAFGLEADSIESFVGFVETAGDPVAAPPLSEPLPDPNDHAFLEVALAGMAAALITGNSRHFPPGPIVGSLKILTPPAFLAAWAKGGLGRA